MMRAEARFVIDGVASAAHADVVGRRLGAVVIIDLIGTQEPLAHRDPTAYAAKSHSVFTATMAGMCPAGLKQFNQAFA